MSPEPLTASDSTAPPASGRGRFRLALAGYGLWVVGLCALAVRTSNPPQLNLAQVSRATLIVTAVVEDAASGRCRVQQMFSPGDPPIGLHVANLSATGAVSGEAYLLPLVRDLNGDDGNYRVVEIADHGIPPLVYPAGPEIEAQLRSWQQPAK